MKTAIIIGATGLIGTELTKQLLKDSRYSVILLLGRNKTVLDHPKLKHVALDFDHPDASMIKGDELFCCLGTTIKTAGSKEVFYKVDHDYVVNTATLARHNGIARIAVVSAMGADSNSSVFYTKTKGDMELAVSALAFEACYIVRPSMLLGNRKEFRLGETIGKWIMIPFSFLIPKKYKAIKDSQVAKSMIHFMNSSLKGNHFIENDTMLNL